MVYPKGTQLVHVDGSKTIADGSTNFDDSKWSQVGGSSTSNTATQPTYDANNPYVVNYDNYKGVIQLDQNIVENLKQAIRNGYIDVNSAFNTLRDLTKNGANSNITDTAFSQGADKIKALLTTGLGTVTSGGRSGYYTPTGNFIPTSASVNTSVSTASGTTASKINIPTINSNLGPGSTGADVTALQDFLRANKFLASDIPSTGYYGEATTAAVAAWQKAAGLNAPANELGYFGPKSQELIKSYGIKTTTTTHDAALFESPEFKALSSDQQATIKSIFEAVSSNDTNSAAQLTAALSKAKDIADPYFKQQISLAVDALNRGFLSGQDELAYNEKSLQDKLAQLKEDIAYSSGNLSLDEQAQLKQLQSTYENELDQTRTELAASGLGSSSRRIKAENLLATTKGDMVESTTRGFAAKQRDLSVAGQRADTATTDEIARLRRITTTNAINAARSTESKVGTSNLPSLPGINPLGGIIGDIPSSEYQDIINAASKFVF